MVQTSATYNPYPLSRHVRVETQLRIVDEGAAEKCTATATNDSTLGISSVSTLATDELYGFGAAYVTLEQDYLRCDKTYTLMPDDFKGGFWSGVSGSASLTFSFSGTVSSMGITMWFDDDGGEWPALVSVSFDSGSTAYEVAPDSGVMRLAFNEIRTYSSIKFSFTKKRNRRIRVSGVMFGIVEEYNNKTIVSWNYSADADHLCQSIPATEQTVRVLADNGRYCITDASLLPAIHPGLRMKTRVIVDGEAVQLSDTILESIQAEGDGLTATIKSYDIAMSLENVGFTCHSDSDYAEWQDGVDGFLREMLKKTGGLYGANKQSGLAYSLPDSKKSIVLYPHHESQTVRTWLSMIGQAIRCHTYIGRDGVIRFIDNGDIDKYKPTTTAAITKKNATKFIQSVEPRVNRVELETALIESDADGDWIESVWYEAHINNLYDGESENTATISNNLLTEEIGRDAAKWMLKQYGRRVEYTAEWRGDPAIDLFDTVSINGDTALVTSLSYTFNGYFHGTIKGVCGLYGMLKDDDITTGRGTG